MRAQSAQRFAEAVERARAAPQPSVDELTTDVFAAEAQP
jgi:TPP-dependent pyruvate/acetoin dehydrogenase alpha subunit